MAEVYGIDVSHHNGKINWKQVAAADIRFAIMKCQYEAKSHNIDETFEYNYAEAGKNHLARGVYIYIARHSIADPVADAQALIKHLNGRVLEYGIWLDLEDSSLKNIGKSNITRLVYIYSSIFRAAGYYVGIYCNKDWYDNVLDKYTLSRDFDFWIARYPSKDTGKYSPTSKLSPKSYAVAWQYSSKGKVPGIKTNTDLNVDFDGVVNLLSSGTAKKSIRDIALEVIDGKWGNATSKPSRKELLTAAGYDYNEVQKVVNKLIR